MGIFQKIGRARKAVEYSHKAVDPMFKMFNLGSLLNKTTTCQPAEMDWEWLNCGQLWIERWGMWMRVYARNIKCKNEKTKQQNSGNFGLRGTWKMWMRVNRSIL